MAAPPPSTTKPALLVNRNFALLWWGQTISVHGDIVFSITLTLLIAFQLAHGQRWAPLAASGILIATALPTLCIRPFAGVLVDRWDKRKTLLVNDALRASVMTLLVVITGVIPLPWLPGGHLPLAWRLGILYMSVLLTSTAAQFFNPALLALTGDIVPPDQRGRAFGLDYLSSSMATVVGPPLAAVLFLAGAQWALLLNALSFALSFALILPIRPPRAAPRTSRTVPPHARREFMQGLRFYAGNATLRTLTIAICLGVLGFGALNALSVFFVQHRLQGNAQTFALIFTSSGVGTILGALVAGPVVQCLGANRVLGLAIVLMGSLVMVLAQITTIPLAIACSFAIGGLEAFLNVAISPILLQATPRELVGRVSSIFQPLYAACALLSIAAAGYLSGSLLVGFHQTFLWFDFDAITTVFTIGGALAIGAGLYALVKLGPLTLAPPLSPSLPTTE